MCVRAFQSVKQFELLREYGAMTKLSLKQFGASAGQIIFYLEEPGLKTHEKHTAGDLKIRRDVHSAPMCVLLCNA